MIQKHNPLFRIGLAIVSTTALLLCFHSQTQAMSARTTQSVLLTNENNDWFSARISAGVLNGVSHELVYFNNGNYKVSELIWRLEDVPVVGLSASAKLPWDMTLSLGGWTQVTNPGSHMEDYDWDNTIHPTDWAYFSYSKTELDRAEMLDSNLLVPILKGKHLALSGMLGFRLDHFQWTDGAGYYIYSSNPGFRDLTGTFPDKPGIMYEQLFMAPYFGFQVEGVVGDFTLSARIAGSRWAWAKGKDQHFNTGMTFRDFFYNVPYITCGGEAGYRLTDAVSVSLSFDAQKYYRTIGYSMEDDHREDNAAGISHKSWVTNLSLEYTF